MHNERLTWTLMPLFLAGVLCETWTVNYEQQQVCAVKGSSVVLLCSFNHPDNPSVERILWGHVEPHGKGRVISGSNNRKATTRFQYIGDTRKNCSMKIHRVDHNNAGKYTVGIITDGKVTWTGSGGLRLKVADLRVNLKPNGNGATTEGDSVNLTCVSSCDCSQISSAFTWYKNGEPINEGCVLHLSNMSSTHSGNYTCSLKSHAGTTSAVRSIDVEYAPKNTSVEVEGGSNITLICSSHANPPVENYTWYKLNDDDDEADIVEVGHQPVFHPGAGGQYLCSAANKHGSQNSSVVTVAVKEYWTTLTRDLLIISAVAVLLCVSTVIWSSSQCGYSDPVGRIPQKDHNHSKYLNRKRKWDPNPSSVDNIQNTDYVNWITRENNQSQEGRGGEGATAGLIYATVDFTNQRTSNMGQQMDPHADDDVDGVIYSTVGRSRPLNPSYIEPL